MATHRRNVDKENEPLVYSFEEEVSSLGSTVKQLRHVSNEVGAEISRQNKILEAMGAKFVEGESAFKRLLESMAGLSKSTGFSPVTLTILFTFAVLLFLWLFVKVFI